MEVIKKTVFLVALICSTHYIECSTVCNATAAAAGNWQNNSYLSIAPFQTNTQQQSNTPVHTSLQGKKRMCPYREYVDVNPRRLPAAMTKIECECGSCMKMQATSYDVLDNFHFCHPVTYPVPVLLERNCTNGMVEYELTTEDIVVACVCRSKYTHTPSNRPTCPNVTSHAHN